MCIALLNWLRARLHDYYGFVVAEHAAINVLRRAERGFEFNRRLQKPSSETRSRVCVRAEFLS